MEKLTILCTSLNGIGHINAVVGIASALKNRGHTIVFAADRSRQGMFSKLGFHEELYQETPGEANSSELANGVFGQAGKPSFTTASECYKIIVQIFDLFFEYTKFNNDRMQEIVDKWKPDVIIEDRVTPMPALVASSVPLVKVCSLNPLYCFDNERLPPAFLGLPLNDKSEWQKQREITREMRSDNVRRINEWLHEVDKSIPKVDINREYVSTNLNIYLSPKALVEDYLKAYPEALGDEWIGLEYSKRPSRGEFEMPEKLRNKPGKLIYISMGTIGSEILHIMKKLVSIFSKSNHRFIFAKGILDKAYDLANNMWGEAYVPQLDILPLVDLVIFHGGNNTLSETLYFAKPLIIMPLFADQFDNAQRVVEKGIGLSFNPFVVEENQLIDAVEFLLNDTVTKKRIQKISQEMRESDSMNKVCEKIEYVAKNPKFPTITGIIDP